MPETPLHRVIQWTTGNVGKSAVEAIAANPGLELVGCYAWSPDKVGRDVGELCGIDPLGVAATNDIDALLALHPDCVVYTPMWLDVDELVRILSAGVNVVATAAFITGHNLGPDRDRILEACERGGSTMFGSGISPGFAELLAVVASGICARVDKVTVNEAADTTFYDSPDTERPAGFGTPIGSPDLPGMAAAGTAVFREAVHLVAGALGVELDEVRCDAEYAQTTEALDLGSWTIDAGCVAGVAASWKGLVGDEVVVELNVRWRKGPDPRTRLEDRAGRLGHPGRRAADGDPQRRLPSAARLRGRDDRRLHGARPRDDGDARHQRDPGRRGGRPGSRPTSTSRYRCPGAPCGSRSDLDATPRLSRPASPPSRPGCR